MKSLNFTGYDVSLALVNGIENATCPRCNKSLYKIPNCKHSEQASN